MDEATPANLAAALSGLQPKDKAPNSSRVHRLPRFSRATTDLDGLVRGDLDRFIAELDQVFARPWGPCTLLRDPVETINVPGRLVKPRRSRADQWCHLAARASRDRSRRGFGRSRLGALAADAAALGMPERTWPARITAHPHWEASFARAARSATFGFSLDAAVAKANAWLTQLDQLG